MAVPESNCHDEECRAQEYFEKEQEQKFSKLQEESVTYSSDEFEALKPKEGPSGTIDLQNQRRNALDVSMTATQKIELSLGKNINSKQLFQESVKK